MFVLPLLFIPLITAFLLLFIHKQKAFAYLIRTSSVLIILSSIFFAIAYFGGVHMMDISHLEFLKPMMMCVEIIMTGYIIFMGLKNKSYPVILLAVAQLGLTLWFEFTQAHSLKPAEGLYIDKLSILMVLIVGIIGSLICIFSVEYMKDYHHHHPEIKDRRNIFFAVLFLFLSAMFALVLMADLWLLLFCWEVTSLCSFLLIGYTRTKEATKNSFTALTINVLGGLLFTIGLVLLGYFYNIGDLQNLLTLDSGAGMVVMSVFLICAAGLTKSAQMPFSKWLLGAMVAPTPTSAMLHSSTMVKAGVYIIIRMAPMLGHNAAGQAVILVGAITFFSASILAVAQSDAKKVLAYSTISNLGLIVTCAGIDTAESLWAAIMLIVFHAIAKSLLFLAVGSTEHLLGSRNIEDMDGLFKVSTPLAMLLIIGIAGMFVAPFGMLISKWAAMKAFVDTHNILIILLVAFGSTVTLFFWTKWIGKLIANADPTPSTGYIMRIDEKVSLYSLASMVVVVCAMFPIISSSLVIPYIDSNLHIDFVSPIGQFNTTLIILMMFMLFLVPLILIPIYKTHKVKRTSVYMSGENTGDNESFYGSMGQVRRVKLENWYMRDIIDEALVTKTSLIICCGILTACLLVIFGGLI